MRTARAIVAMHSSVPGAPRRNYGDARVAASASTQHSAQAAVSGRPTAVTVLEDSKVPNTLALQRHRRSLHVWGSTDSGGARPRWELMVNARKEWEHYGPLHADTSDALADVAEVDAGVVGVPRRRSRRPRASLLLPLPVNDAASRQIRSY